MPRALIVEDYQAIKDTYAVAFSKSGFGVETAASGAEALQKVAQSNFDIIILDLVMLELSGLDFLRGYDLSKHPNVKVIVVTNIDSRSMIQKAQALGVNRFLVKAHHTPKEVVAAAQELLDSTPQDKKSPKPSI